MTTTTETLTGYLARPVTMSVKDADKVVTDIHTFPAGTEVYATERRGQLRIRVCGTLYTQTVNFGTVVPA